MNATVSTEEKNEKEVAVVVDSPIIRKQYFYLHTLIRPKKLFTFGKFWYSKFECEYLIDYYNVALHFSQSELESHGLVATSLFNYWLCIHCLFPWYLNPYCFALVPVFWLVLRINLLVDLLCILLNKIPFSRI